MLTAGAIRRVSGVLLTPVTWLAILIAPFIAIALLDFYIDREPHAESMWEVRRASVLVSDVAAANQLPADGWREVTMPNRQTHYGYNSYSGWYRIEVVVPTETSALWAVYFPAPNANYELSVNGQFVAATGPTVPPIPRYLIPVILKFPGALLHSGKNIVDVRITGEIPAINLRYLYVGPYDVLGPVYDVADWWGVGVKQIFVICMVVMSLTMLVIFRLRPRDAAFGWYAFALLFWALSIEVKLIPRPPFPITQLWINIPRIAIGWYVVCGAFFVNRFVGATHAHLERWYLCWAFFGSAVLVIDPLVFGYRAPWFHERIWLPPIIVLGIYETWQLVHAARDRSNVEARMLAIVTWWALAAGLSDVLMNMGVLRFRPQYLAYFVGPVLLVFGLVLLSRFVKAADVVERTRAELEVRVAEKALALERDLVRLKDLEREQALSAERERIMRDMHDGVGGQLMHALSIATGQPELRSMEVPLRACLDELRLIVDSIEPTEGDLATVLRTLRTRMSRQLMAANVQVHWHVGNVPALSTFGPQRVVQVTRVVQEAIANALKHSRAKQITVRVFVTPRSSDNAEPAVITIEIADDGIGLAIPESGGRGLSNMRRRAEDLGAQLIISSSATGTTVRIELPIDASANKESIAAQAPGPGMELTP